MTTPFFGKKFTTLNTTRAEVVIGAAGLYKLTVLIIKRMIYMQKISKWIWQKSKYDKDVYCEFVDTFVFDGRLALLQISADSNYAVYINGEFADLGQYPDFPHYKVYDEIDVTKYCQKGNNTISVMVWYFGKDSGHANYYPGNAALRYEIYADGEIIAYSDEKTLSRISNTYKNGYCRRLSGHIPYSYSYDFTKEDDWKLGRLKDFTNSIAVDQKLEMFRRPIAKPVIERKPVNNTLLDIKNHTIYDLAREETGYLTFSINSAKEQKILIAYSEHIDMGYVNFRVDDRNFSFEYTLKAGKNTFFNPFIRLGARFLEIIAKDDIEIEYISILPAYYKLDKREFHLENELDQTIYDVCVRTLELCMHEHYEDCPWREQALYALDSRNQMLCGYYAFGEYEFPRSNLLLMNKDRRDDALLTITVPCETDLAITSFSLFYIIETYEYIAHSNDISLLKEIHEKLTSIISVFLNHMDGDLLPVFQGENYWNFYEWSEGLEGKLRECDEYKFDTPLNCIFSLALKAMHKMNEKLGITDSYNEIANVLNLAVNKNFYNKKDKVFVNSSTDNRVSELTNALAILCGAVEGEEALDLAKKLADKNNSFTGISLSMIGFKYDALIKVGKDRYKDYILEDIRNRYKPMLDNGATAFWETETADGQGDATSRCHGWSAMPVYYYHTLWKKDDTLRYYE